MEYFWGTTLLWLLAGLYLIGIVGCIICGASKGYPLAGVLLCPLSLIGLLIVLCCPDKTEQTDLMRRQLEVAERAAGQTQQPAQRSDFLPEDVYLRVASKVDVLGMYTVKQVREMMQTGQLSAVDHFCESGGQWVRLVDQPGL